MKRKPGIPDTAGLPAEVRVVVDPIKENLEVLLGRRGGAANKLPALGSTATLADCINQLERIRKLLQDDSV